MNDMTFYYCWQISVFGYRHIWKTEDSKYVCMGEYGYVFVFILLLHFLFCSFLLSLVVVRITYFITRSKFDFVQYLVYDQNAAKTYDIPITQHVKLTREPSKKFHLLNINMVALSLWAFSSSLTESCSPIKGIRRVARLWKSEMINTINIVNICPKGVQGKVERGQSGTGGLKFGKRSRHKLFSNRSSTVEFVSLISDILVVWCFHKQQ